MIFLPNQIKNQFAYQVQILSYSELHSFGRYGMAKKIKTTYAFQNITTRLWAEYWRMGGPVLTVTSVSSALWHLLFYHHAIIVRNVLKKNTSVTNSLKLNVSPLTSENIIFRWKMKTFFLLFCYYCLHSLTVDRLNFKRLFHADVHRIHVGSIRNWGSYTAFFEKAGCRKDLWADLENHTPFLMVMLGSIIW